MIRAAGLALSVCVAPLGLGYGIQPEIALRPDQISDVALAAKCLPTGLKDCRVVDAGLASASPGAPELRYQLQAGIGSEAAGDQVAVVLDPKTLRSVAVFGCDPCVLSKPRLHTHAQGWILHMPGRVDGSLRANEDQVFQLRSGKWIALKLPEPGAWPAPAGYEFKQDVRYDFGAWTAETGAFLPTDGSSSRPSGGCVVFDLTMSGLMIISGSHRRDPSRTC